MLKDAKIVQEYVLLNALLHIFCWFEANVGPGTVFGTNEPSTEFGYHWFDAHVHDHSWETSSSVSRALSDISYDLHHTYQLVAKLLDYVGSPSSLWELCFSFHA